MMPVLRRHVRTGVAAACIAALAPGLAQAQEYLPPVIDRSSGAVQAAPARSEPPRQQAVPAASASSALEERVKRLERLLDNEALVDMLMRLDGLQSETESLRGSVETIGHELEGLKQRQRDLYLDIDRRMREIEVSLGQIKSGAAASPGAPATAGAAPSLTAPAASLPTAAAPAAAAGGGDPAAERDTYQQAFNLLKEGQYDKAITEFQAFLSSYPQGEYTANAQYWLGEANYVTRRFEVAEKEFRKVLDRHPDSNKLSDAMLKLGYTLYEQGSWDAARTTLENVTQRFPGTTVARLADNRLQKMRLEGR